MKFQKIKLKMSINKEDNDIEDSNEKLEKVSTSEISEENQDENKDYLIIVFMKNIKINLLIIISIFLVFISEFFFRKPLFDYSLSFEKKWQENSLESTITFFKIITKLCGEYLMAIPVAFVLCFCSMIKSSFYIAGLIFDLHFHSLMKIWYGNKRPFWEDPELYKGICDGGFGNPSGHSISSVYLYFTLFIYIIDSKTLENRTIIKIIIFLLFLVYTVLIILSRIILGIHSINQIIYGTVLGLFTSLLIVQVFKLHKMPIGFYKRIYKEKIIIFCTSCMMIILALFSVLSCLTFNKKFDYEHYDKILLENCKDIAEYRKFNNDGLFGSLVILALLGMYLGQVLFWYLIDNFYKIGRDGKKIESVEISNEISYIADNYDEKKNNKIIDGLINNWNENRTYINCNTSKAFKICLILIICCIPLSLFLFVSKNGNIVVVFIFKIAIPFFSTMFLIYSIGFYYMIKILCGEKDELLNKVNKQIIDNNFI